MLTWDTHSELKVSSPFLFYIYLLLLLFVFCGSQGGMAPEMYYVCPVMTLW